MNSVVENLGTEMLPEFKGDRVLMMPIHLHDVKASVPENLKRWIPFIEKAVELGPCKQGTAYLTIDESVVESGRHHRRPGLHVDGWQDEGGTEHGGGWGGGGGWGSQTTGEGMIIATNYLGSVGWHQEVEGWPKIYGDCEHLRPKLNMNKMVPFLPNTLYRLDGLTVHESIPVRKTVSRQFFRLSMPSDGVWPSSNTPNPLCIMPEGKITSPRPEEFTKYGSK